MNNKEFDRSVCFQFYESYLEQAVLVKEQLGPEMCAEYFIALVRYGLYQEESTKPMIKMLISGLKNTIDAGQLKREKAFCGENKELTKQIIKYKEDNPNSTQREIADACQCSVGKVNKTLNSNNNINNNSNTNSNNNSVNVNVNKEEVRDIEDLTEEEAKAIINLIHKKVKYIDIQNQYNLKYGSVTKNFEKQWTKIYEARKKELIEKQLEKDRDMYVEFSNYLSRDLEDTTYAFTHVDFFKQTNITNVIEFCRKFPEYSYVNWCKSNGLKAFDEYDDDYSYKQNQNKYIVFFRKKLAMYEGRSE
jgi:hypothetical protein